MRVSIICVQIQNSQQLVETTCLLNTFREQNRSSGVNSSLLNFLPTKVDGLSCYVTFSCAHTSEQLRMLEDGSF